MKSIAEIFRSYAILDSDGRHVNGTDKETNHRYGDAYEKIFSFEIGQISIIYNNVRSMREDVKLMMEVGVADGSCLLAWRDIFPNATIVGMDIHHSDKAHGERIEFHLGDQRKREDCERAAGGRLFDVIVEDALHDLDATLRTLLFLWPSVRPGGLYIVEEFADIHSLRRNVEALWPGVEIVSTSGPYGGDEPLVIFRKPA